MRDLLSSLAYRVYDGLTNALRYPSDFIYNKVWDLIWWLENERNWWYDQAAPWLYDAIGWIPGGNTIVDWLGTIYSGLWDFGLRMLYPVRDFFDNNYDGGWREWWWVARVREATWNLVEMAYEIGSRLDKLGEDPWRTVGEIVAPLLDPLGNGMGWIAEILDYPGGNPWGWIRANSPNIWAALQEVARVDGYAIQDALDRLRSWALDLLLTPTDWVGLALGELQRLIAGSGYNSWDFVKSTSSDRSTALLTMARAIADSIGNRFTEVYTSLQYWAGLAIAAALVPFSQWIASTQSLIDWVEANYRELQLFLDKPGDYIWAKLLPALWPRIEAWLITVWDGTDRRQ